MATAGYVLLSREIGLFRQMDSVANNVANVNTNGFKADRLIFAQHLSALSNDRTSLNRKVSFANDVTEYTDYSEGALNITKSPLDIAIKGKGFFQIQTDDGVKFTRSGNFQIGPNNTLVDSTGNEVLSSDGSSIAFAQGDVQIDIANDGTITATNDGKKEERGSLGIVIFENPDTLKKVGNSMYDSTEAPQQTLAVTDFSLVQGALENSNVNSVQEVTRMIETSRTLALATGMSKDLDDLERKAISTISRQG